MLEGITCVLAPGESQELPEATVFARPPFAANSRRNSGAPRRKTKQNVKLKTQRSLLHREIMGRGGRILTFDLLVPNQE
jgi:hypothetical protein